jgi:hypothetical protein
MRMKTLARAVVCAALCAAGCGDAFLAAGCAKMPVVGTVLAGDDLPRRVSEARVVLVGRMASLEERAVTGEELEAVDGRPVTKLVWYDVAALDVLEVLKGVCGDGTVSVRFLSFDQTQYPPRDRARCRAFSSYDIWNPGIWIIDFDSHIEPRFAVQRGNFLPISMLDKVKAALGKQTSPAADEK